MMFFVLLSLSHFLTYLAAARPIGRKADTLATITSTNNKAVCIITHYKRRTRPFLL